MTDFSKLADLTANLNKMVESKKFPSTETAYDKARKSIESSLGTSLAAYHELHSRMKDLLATHSLNKDIERIGRSLGDQHIYGHDIDYYDQITTYDPIRHFDGISSLPTNPISETNEHLESLIVKIDLLTDLQARQADIVDKLLNAFVEGSVSQEKAASANLRVARISAALAGVAILATVLTAFPIV